MEPSSETPTATAGQTADPSVMVIFGASGDLTKRKLIPALYNLEREKLLSKDFAVVGISRREMSHDAFREKLTEDIKSFATTPVESNLWDEFVKRVYYLAGDMEQPETYSKLQSLLNQVDQDHGTKGNYFYYLATAPRFFASVVEQLGAAVASPVAADGFVYSANSQGLLSK